MVHSFGFDFSPWGEYAKYFRAELSQRMQEPVDLYDIPLSSARFDSQPDHQAFADYLNALFSGRRLDLVVTLGAPAARFFQQHRSGLFSSTPMLMTALDQRVVPANLTPNDTTVSVAVDFKSVVENILKVRPQTTTIAVVVGTSPIEQYWKEQMRDAFETFGTRVTFEWFDRVSLAEMLDRAKTLPPRSSIFYFVLFVDGAGVSHGETAALTSLVAAANAPVFSYVDAYLGQGIVGGPLLSVQEISHRAAIVAARILGGQVAGEIKTRPIGFAEPKFDFREMQRWGIRDSQLPPGSEVLFRPPTAWEQYRWQIVLAGTVFAIQTFALIGLFYEHRRRRKAEVLARTSMFELSRSEKELRDAFETIPAMAWTTRADGTNDFANRGWSEFSGMSSMDTSGVGWKAAFHSADIDTHAEKFYASLAAGTPFENEARVKRASDGEYRWFLHRAVPLRDEHGNILKWYGVSTEIDDRKRAEQALREREARIRRLVDANIIGVFVGDVQGRILEANDAFLRIVGYDRQDLISGRMRVRDMTPPQWRDRTARTMAEVKLGKAVQPYEKEYFRKDGAVVYPCWSARRALKNMGTRVSLSWSI